MKDLLKNELKTFAQYFVIILLAGWLEFIISFGGIRGINIKEAWLNYEPLMRGWLIIISALSLARLLLILLARKTLPRLQGQSKL